MAKEGFAFDAVVKKSKAIIVKQQQQQNAAWAKRGGVEVELVRVGIGAARPPFLSSSPSAAVVTMKAANLGSSEGTKTRVGNK